MELTKVEFLNRIDDKFCEFKTFVKKYNKHCYFEDVGNGVIRMDEVEVGEHQFLINVTPSNNNVEFIDDLDDYEKYYEGGYDIDHEFQRERLTELTKQIETVSKRFCYSGNGGNDFYLWYS